jgi:hypothetical protein
MSQDFVQLPTSGIESRKIGMPTRPLSPSEVEIKRGQVGMIVPYCSVHYRNSDRKMGAALGPFAGNMGESIQRRDFLYFSARQNAYMALVRHIAITIPMTFTACIGDEIKLKYEEPD